MEFVRAWPGEHLDSSVPKAVVFGRERILVDADLANRFFGREPGSGKTNLDLPGEAVKPGADTIALSDFVPVPKTPEEDNSSLTSTYADVLPQYPGKEKLEFESAFDKKMTNGQWAPSAGVCFGMKNGEWVKVWETVMPDLFNPLPLVGDFDGDWQ